MIQHRLSHEVLGCCANTPASCENCQEEIRGDTRLVWTDSILFVIKLKVFINPKILN